MKTIVALGGEGVGVEGIGNGPLKGERVDPEQFLAARRLYYEMAGWDPDTGRPTAAKLAELRSEERRVGKECRL